MAQLQFGCGEDRTDSKRFCDATKEIGTSIGSVPVAETTGNLQLPAGWTPNHTSPDEYVVRCNDCGVLTKTTDRGDAHSRADEHVLSCNTPTGVTPVARASVEVPVPGTIATIRYESARTGNVQTARGPVEDTIPTGERADHYDVFVRDVARDRLVVLRYDAEQRSGEVSTLIDGDERELGTLVELDITPTAIDGEQESPENVQTEPRAGGGPR